MTNEERYRAALEACNTAALNDTGTGIPLRALILDICARQNWGTERNADQPGDGLCKHGIDRSIVECEQCRPIVARSSVEAEFEAWWNVRRQMEWANRAPQDAMPSEFGNDWKHWARAAWFNSRELSVLIRSAVQTPAGPTK